jgi:hypothetical protein
VASGDDPDARLVVQGVQKTEEALARDAEGVVYAHCQEGLHGGATSGGR